jgi:hypothetical protein
MAIPSATNLDALGRRSPRDFEADNAHLRQSGHAHASAVAWGAIFAGAAAAAALSLILLILGTGLGLSSVSPWNSEGISATTFGVSTIVWITFTQLLASGLGGYLAGRLRTKWIEVHTDEVYFRDTAHGFLAWAVASLATAALLTSVIGAIVGVGVKAGTSVASSIAGGAAAGAAAGTIGPGSPRAESDMNPTAYFVDALFRRETNAASTGAAGTAVGSNADSAPQRAASAAEVSRIFINSLRTGPLPEADARYVAQLVAQRTGLSQSEAETRVNETYARMQAKLREAEAAAKDAADKARKASAYAALWLFISLLVGAFTASLAATFGGRRRDA